MYFFSVWLTEWLAQENASAETRKELKEVPATKERGGRGESVARNRGYALFNFIQAIPGEKICEWESNLIIVFELNCWHQKICQLKRERNNIKRFKWKSH